MKKSNKRFTHSFIQKSKLRRAKTLLSKERIPDSGPVDIFSFSFTNYEINTLSEFSALGRKCLKVDGNEK